MSPLRSKIVRARKDRNHECGAAVSRQPACVFAKPSRFADIFASGCAACYHLALISCSYLLEGPNTVARRFIRGGAALGGTWLMFDPYHKWLGIRPEQRPPTYYQLLGIAPDEKDPEVIRE